jgi:hypothetical protein
MPNPELTLLQELSQYLLELHPSMRKHGAVVAKEAREPVMVMVAVAVAALMRHQLLL